MSAQLLGHVCAWVWRHQLMWRHACLTPSQGMHGRTQETIELPDYFQGLLGKWDLLFLE